MTEDYLKKVSPTFDMLFQLVDVILQLGEGEEAKLALLILKSQKSFDLLWKSYTGGEKGRFRAKWQKLGLEIGELK